MEQKSNVKSLAKVKNCDRPGRESPELQSVAKLSWNESDRRPGSHLNSKIQQSPTLPPFNVDLTLKIAAASVNVVHVLSFCPLSFCPPNIAMGEGGVSRRFIVPTVLSMIIICRSKHDAPNSGSGSPLLSKPN